VEHDEKVGLEAEVVVDDPEHVRRRVVRAEHRRVEVAGERLQLAQVHGRLPEHEIEVEGGHRRPLERGCRVADEHGLELRAPQRLGEAVDEGPGVHDDSLPVVATRRRERPGWSQRPTRSSAPRTRVRLRWPTI
jgi:hypothetical protein